MNKKFLTIIVFLFLLNSVNFAKSINNYFNSPVDQFNRISESDMRARTDNFFVTITNNKGFKGCVTHYQGTDSIPYKLEGLPWTLGIIQDQINFRDFDKSRITFIESDFIQEEERTTYWLYPKDLECPKDDDGISKRTISKKKTFLYDKTHLNVAGGEFELASVIEKQKENPDESPFSAEAYYKGLTREEKEERKFSWIHNYFGEFLNYEKDLTGIIILYADENYYDIDKITVLVKQGRKKIQDKYKLSPSKIQVFYGGFRHAAEVEFWIMTKDSKFPEVKPDTKENEHSTNE